MSQFTDFQQHQLVHTSYNNSYLGKLGEFGFCLNALLYNLYCI